MVNAANQCKTLKKTSEMITSFNKELSTSDENSQNIVQKWQKIRRPSVDKLCGRRSKAA